MKKTSIFVLVLALLLVFTCSAFAAPTPPINAKTPLPKEINIVAPGPEVPPELAAFSGIWVGKWKWDYYRDGVKMERDTVVIVEKIEGDKVHLVFSWGELRPFYSTTAYGWTRLVGTYNSATKSVVAVLKPPTASIQADTTFMIKADGTMSGYRPKLVPDASDYKAIYVKQP